MAGQGGNGNAVVCQQLLQVIDPVGVLQIIVRVTVGLIGIPSGAQLHAVHADGAQVRQHLGQRLIPERDGQNAQFHMISSKQYCIFFTILHPAAKSNTESPEGLSV